MPAIPTGSFFWCQGFWKRNSDNWFLLLLSLHADLAGEICDGVVGNAAEVREKHEIPFLCSHKPGTDEKMSADCDFSQLRVRIGAY